MESKGIKGFIAGLAAAICLSAVAYVTYPVPVKQGGTGAATLTGFLFGNGTSPVSALTNLSWDNTNYRLGIGSTPPLLAKYSANSLYLWKSDVTQAYPITVSAGPATNSLMLLRGGSTAIPAAGSCNTSFGEGYSCARTGTGTYTVTFTTAFKTKPACVCNNSLGACAALAITSQATLAVTVGGVASDQTFDFICLGERPD
jgi:hypothetical protein